PLRHGARPRVACALLEPRSRRIRAPAAGAIQAARHARQMDLEAGGARPPAERSPHAAQARIFSTLLGLGAWTAARHDRRPALARAHRAGGRARCESRWRRAGATRQRAGRARASVVDAPQLADVGRDLASAVGGAGVPGYRTKSRDGIPGPRTMTGAAILA